MFYHIFPCRSVFLLELTLSSGEREGGAEKGILTYRTVRGFLFFSFVDCIPVFSLFLSLSLHLHLFLYLWSFLEKERHFYLVDLSYSRLLT